MKPLFAVVLFLPVAASAATLDCSIKASRTQKNSEMTTPAKVSVQDARKAALGAVTAKGASITNGGLEVEDGCLVYSYDIKVPGKAGVEEVLIDAGTGKVLSIEHETAANEAAEKAVDKVKK